MVSHKYQEWFKDNREKFNELARTAKKINLAQIDLNFLNNCSSHQVLPNFTKLKNYTVRQGRLTPKQIVSARFKILEKEILSKTDHIRNIKNNYETKLKAIHDVTSQRL